MEKNSKIFVAGHRGLVGSAIVRELQKQGFQNLILKTRSELNLLDAEAVKKFFETEKPEYIFLAAAKVGGILANDTYPADFLYENLVIQNNVIHQSFQHKVKKLLFLGSSCIYRNDLKREIHEDDFLNGPLEKTNEAYAIAKIAGIKLCQFYQKQHGCNFVSVMPTNMYGPGDNYDLRTSHVLPALIRKFHEAKKNGNRFVEVWGSGKPKREFLYSDDLAQACIFLMQNYNDPALINIGTGTDLSIKELAFLIKKIIGFEGEIKFDSSKPDGTYRKFLNISKIKKLGWRAKINLEDGIRMTYEDFKSKS